MSIHNILVPNNLDIKCRTITPSGPMIIPGNSYVNGNLLVNGNGTFIGDIHTNNDINANNDVNVNNNLTVFNTITTNGYMTVNDSATITGTLSCGTCTSTIANTSTLNVTGASNLDSVTALGPIASGASILAIGSVTGSEFSVQPGVATPGPTNSITRTRYWQGSCPIYANSTDDTGFSVDVKIQRINNIVTIVVDPFGHIISPGFGFYVAVRLPDPTSEPFLIPEFTATGGCIQVTYEGGTEVVSLVRITSTGTETYVSFYNGLSPGAVYTNGSNITLPNGISFSYSMTN